MRKAGVTLLEVMVSVAILTVVTGVLFVLATSLGEAARTQEAKTTTLDDARNAMLVLTRELRQAAANSFSALPGATLTYRIAQDVDGNGSAVNLAGDLELSTPRTVGRDFGDVNGDGRRATQLILQGGGRVRVLANALAPNEDTNGNGVLDAGEDANGNRRLDRGIWFERVGPGIRITIDSQRMADARGRPMTSRLVEVVDPRN